MLSNIDTFISNVAVMLLPEKAGNHTPGFKSIEAPISNDMNKRIIKHKQHKQVLYGINDMNDKVML